MQILGPRAIICRLERIPSAVERVKRFSACICVTLGTSNHILSLILLVRGSLPATQFGTSIMTSESDEAQIITFTRLVNDEHVRFARTANCNHGDWGPEPGSSICPLHDGLSLAVTISLVS